MESRKLAIVIAIGSTGDVNPMLGIALTLRRRGHNVLFVANPIFRRFAETGRLSFSALGTEKDYDFIWDAANWRWWSCMKSAFRNCWLSNLRPVYEQIASVGKSSSTVVVANIVAAGAQLARDKLGIPFVMVTPSSLVFQNLDEFPDYGPFQRAPRRLGKTARRAYYGLADLAINAWIGNGVNRLRSTLGLGPIRKFFSHWVGSGDRILGLWPKWYGKPQRSWPSQVTLTGFPNYDRDDLHSEQEVPVVPNGEAAPIVFTCGSAATHTDAFLKVAIGVSKILRRRVVVVADHPWAGTSIELPTEVMLTPYVPFRRLLPRSVAVVHHGGIGTATAALAAGLPQLMVPLAFDQFHNAERFEALGVSRKISRWNLSSPKVAAALRFLLASDEVKESCRHWRDVVVSENGLARACECIEELLGSAAAKDEDDAELRT